MERLDYSKYIEAHEDVYPQTTFFDIMDNRVSLDMTILGDKVELGLITDQTDSMSIDNVYSDWLDITSLRDVLSSYVDILNKHIHGEINNG